MKKKKPGEAANTNGVKHLAPVESVVFDKLHSLVAHCCVTQYDDGDARRPGWVTLKTLGSSWCVQVKDPDAAVSLTAMGATLDDALALAELLLSSEEAPWEPDAFLKKGQAKK